MIRQFLWRMMLPGWYFVLLHHETVAAPLFWNGMVWEDRTRVIEDKEIKKVMGMIAN